MTPVRELSIRTWVPAPTRQLSEELIIPRADLLCDDNMLRTNALNPMRLGFAVLVVLSHSFPLTRGNNDVEPLALLSQGTMTLGALGLDPI
jgi:hypothetical protein